LACENGDWVRVAFALDCCDREAMSYIATLAVGSDEELRDLTVAAVEHRFGRTYGRFPRECQERMARPAASRMSAC
jgi:hypothetical protein